MANAAQKSKIKERAANRQKPVVATAVAPAATVEKPVKPAKVKAAPVQESPEITPNTKVRGPSIRGLITTALSEGKSTTEISDMLKEQFPDSKAAEKATKHISFYRSRMKKAAGAPAVEAEAPAPAKAVATKGAAKAKA